MQYVSWEKKRMNFIGPVFRLTWSTKPMSTEDFFQTQCEGGSVSAALSPSLSPPQVRLLSERNLNHRVVL